MGTAFRTLRPTVYENGFTLIELSIVLVIIGLIVGGVLVGQGLIAAAGVRATITQIEKYNQAVNTFRGKYGALPGDMNAATATQFGFAARGQYAGQGDGNGIIEGVFGNSTNNNYGNAEGAGETVIFWVDLSAVNLIEGSFTLGSPSINTSFSGTTVASYFPPAKVGNGNFIYVYEGYQSGNGGNGMNYFGLSAVTSVSSGALASNPGLTVSQAYAIDNKIDDGFPQMLSII